MNRARTELCRKTSPTLKRCIHSTNHKYSPKATSANRIKGSGQSSSSPPQLLVNNRGTIPKSFGVGMLGGTLGSFVGIGGGVFTIPIMTSSVFGLTQRQAMATNLVAVMFTGIAGASAYAAASNNNNDVDAESNASDVIDSRSRDETEKGNDTTLQLNKLQTLFSTANNTDSNVQIDMAITAAVAGMITARLGARISNRLTEKALKRFLAGVMYIAAPAVHLPEFMEKGYNDDEKVEEESSAVVAVGKENVVASSALKEESSSNKDATKEVQQQQKQLLSEEYVMTRLVPAAMIGSGAGVFSGVTGLGGGIITVSAFSLLTPLSYKQALGTSLCAMAFPATSAAIAHHLNGNIVWRVAPFLAAGAACGAFLGGKIGSNLPEKELKYSFSAVMLALGTKVLLRV